MYYTTTYKNATINVAYITERMSVCNVFVDGICVHGEINYDNSFWALLSGAVAAVDKEVA